MNRVLVLVKWEGYDALVIIYYHFNFYFFGG
jgi:hypothetical protein